MSPSILLVEDHDIMAQMLSRFLRERGEMTVWARAATAEEALAKLGAPSSENALPDLVLSDVSMPGMSGIELAAELTRLYPKLPCLLVSAHQDIRYVRQAMANGARGYVAKEDPTAILAAIRQVLAGEVYVEEEMQDPLASARREEWSAQRQREQQTLPFLGGGGEMGERIRAFDWSQTSLGAAAAWPQSLKTAVALMLGAGSPLAICWGDNLLFLYNDPWRGLMGEKHPDALGRSAHTVFPEIWEKVGPQLRRVLNGEGAIQAESAYLPLERWDEVEAAWFDYSYNPIFMASGAVGGVFAVAVEVTEQKRLAAAKQAAAKLEQFRSALANAIRPLADPAAVQKVVSRLLGEYLEADRALYAEMERDGRTLSIAADYCRSGIPSVAGRHQLESFGAYLTEALRAGRTQAVEDIRNISVLTPEETAAFDAMQVQAYISVPILKGNTLVACLEIHQAQPRVWTADEGALVEEVAEQTWNAVQRAHAEAALRRSTARQSFLLRLGDALRPLLDPTEVQAVASRMLGKYLGVNRVSYAEIAGAESIVRSPYVQGVSPLPTPYQYGELTEGALKSHNQGEILAVTDVETDPRFTEAELEAFRAAEVAAFVGFVLLKEEEWVAALGVHNAAPRQWQPAELDLIGEVAERTWEASERAAAEAALRESHERLALALTASNAGIYEHPVPTGEKIYRSGRWEEILGYPNEELPASGEAFFAWFYEQVHPEDRAYLQEQYEEFIMNRRPDYEVTIRVCHKSGAWRWIRGLAAAITRDADGKVTRILGVMMNITDLKQAEQEVRELNEQLEERVEKRTAEVRSLSAQLAIAEHEERSRIAQLLHDDLQQQLYSIQIHLSFLADHTADEQMIEDIGHLKDSVSTATATTRRLSVELSPPLLEGTGLVESVFWLGNQMQERFGLKVTVEAKGKFTMPDLDRRVLLFQSIQELLFNVVKHAQVEAATVRLQRVEDEGIEEGEGRPYRIDILDKGVGFDANKVLDDKAPPTGSGLVHIRERLRYIGGRLDVQSVPGKGTQMSIFVPPHRTDKKK